MKRKKHWTPAVGDIVSACYDGKWGRAQDAEVLSVGAGGNQILIRFIPWGEEDAEPVTMWCGREFKPRHRDQSLYSRLRRIGRRKTRNGYREMHSPHPIPNSFGGWLVRPHEWSLLRVMFGCPGCWYSVYNRDELVAEGYAEPLQTAAT